MSSAIRASRHAWTLIEMMIAILVISILAAISLSIGSAVLSGAEVRRTEDMLKILDASLLEYASAQGREPSHGINGDPLADTDLHRGSRYDIDLDPILDGLNSCSSCNGADLSTLDYRSGGLPDEEEVLSCAMWSQVGGCNTSDTDDDLYLGIAAQVFWRLNSNSASHAMLASSDPSLVQGISVLVEQDGASVIEKSVRFIDAWDNPIIVVLPGRDWSDRHDGDGIFGSRRQDADGSMRTKEEQMLGPALRAHAYFVSAGPDGKFGNIGYDQALNSPYDPNPTSQGFIAAQDNIYSYEVSKW